MKRIFSLSWALLLLVTVFGMACCELLRLPAAPMLAGLIVGSFWGLRDTGIHVPDPFFLLGQSVVGLMISRSFNIDVLHGMLDNWLLALVIVLIVVLFGFLCGGVITVKQWLPGTTGIWGSCPGAATLMTIMSEANGGDMRLVAIMQYMRVVIVSLAAALVTRFLGVDTAQAAAAAPSYWESLFPAVDHLDFALTIALILFCCVLSKVIKFGAGPFVIPLCLGAVFQNLGLMRIVLPGWLLAVSFMLIGWNVGLRFNRSVFLYAWRAMPKILGTIAFMLVSSGILAAVLVYGWHIDPVTAYLATSPGGADAVAIIAASGGADMVFVMAIQTVRLFFVLVTGPPLARIAMIVVQKR